MRQHRLHLLVTAAFRVLHDTYIMELVLQDCIETLLGNNCIHQKRQPSWSQNAVASSLSLIACLLIPRECNTPFAHFFTIRLMR
jgi:hypothetical protein